MESKEYLDGSVFGTVVDFNGNKTIGTHPFSGGILKKKMNKMKRKIP
jgi:hypothetical protein